MTKIKMRASKEAFEKAAQDQGDFVVPKPGIYTMVLKECNAGFSKDDDGNEDKNRPRLECIYEIVGVGKEDAPVTENYGNIWDYVSFSEASEWKRAEFMMAMGIATGDGAAEAEIDTDEVTGTKVMARLKHQTRGKGPDATKQAKVAKLFRWSEGGAAFGGEDDGADTSDAFGGDEPESEAEGAEDEYLTEEGLSELDLKALGETAKEFDLDPNEYVVRKNKKVDVDATKAAVIAAILEAQGAGDDAGDGEDDESPF